jgi:hypothetical protein
MSKIKDFFDSAANPPLNFQDKGLLSFGLWSSSTRLWVFLIREFFGKSRRYEVGCVKA